MSSGLMLTALFLDQFYSDNMKGLKTIHAAGYILAFVTFAFLHFLIPYCKLFLNANSLDQILFGWLLGVWLAVFMQFIVQDSMIEDIDAMMLYPKSFSDQDYSYRLWGAFFMFLAGAFALFCIYYVNLANYTVDVYWLLFYSQSCNPSDISNAIYLIFNIFLDNALTVASFAIFGFSAYIGVLIEAKYILGQSWYTPSDAWWKGIIRLLLTIIFAIPFLAFGISQAIPYAGNNTYIFLLLAIIAPFFCFGVFIFSIGNLLFHFMGLAPNPPIPNGQWL